MPNNPLNALKIEERRASQLELLYESNNKPSVVADMLREIGSEVSLEGYFRDRQLMFEALARAYEHIQALENDLAFYRPLIVGDRNAR